MWNKVDGGTVYDVIARWLESYADCQGRAYGNPRGKLTSWIHNAFPWTAVTASGCSEPCTGATRSGLSSVSFDLLDEATGKAARSVGWPRASMIG